MADGELITWSEAIKQTNEDYGRFQSIMEAGRLAEAEQHRLDYQTSIECGHRDTERDYIMVGEFDFQLCDECQAMIVTALKGGS